MRILQWALIATVMGLGFAGPVSAQNLPSDVEQKLGIPPNSANPGSRNQRDIYRYERGDRSSYAEDRLARCQRRADRRGLDGREFRRFVRYCMDRD
jgi:hypothetical protein